MENEGFDAIVVGAGMAGLACAGELVLQGARPLLICETEEVGAQYRTQWVGKNRGILQTPTWQNGWGGGWWYPLVRALNIPVRLGATPDLGCLDWGSRKYTKIPYCPTASAITDVIIQTSPLPIDAIRGAFEQLTHAALAIPWEDLLEMHQVPMAEWLTDQGADEMVQQLMVVLLANLNGIPVDEAQELSVFGAWGTLRTVLCREGTYMHVEPDCREGLCIPIAQEVERRGGSVWRGRRVAQVLTDGGRVGGVVMEDGVEVRAPIVAIATGNKRISALLDPLPPEVEEPLAYSARFTSQDFCLYTVLDKPVVSRDMERFVFVVGTDGTNLGYSYPIHLYPGAAEPGRQFVATIKQLSGEAALREEKEIYDEMRELCEALYPGFAEATVDSATLKHRYQWSGGTLVGPKVPRTVESVEGLWFVGDGSWPVRALWMDGAASAGILGARAMAEA